MDEYNKLTIRLLEEGCSVDNYPDYVNIDSSRWGKDPLQNLAGGFVYKPWYEDRFIYMTGCGKHVKSMNVINDMFFMGVQFSHENDNVVIRCPWDKPECELNNPILHGTRGGGLCIQCFCECHRTSDTYDFGNSIERANKERQDEADRKYVEFSEKHHGRVCRQHMHYNERKREWALHYRPSECAKGCYSNGFCPIRNKTNDTKKGNVFYDLKTSFIRQDGTLFDGEEIISITKGIRFFNHPVNMDTCRDFVKIQSHEIYRKYYENHGARQYDCNKTFKAEILNIRAESRETRDLLKDLEDIRNGIKIVHNSDVQRQKKEEKAEEKKERINRKILKVGKKILLTGYESLDFAEKRFSEKYITEETLKELNVKMRERAKKKEKMEQMEISEFM